MDPTTVTAFFDELQAIEKQAGVKETVLALKKGTSTLKKGVTAPLKAGKAAYDAAGQKAFQHAGKVVGTSTANKVVMKGTELLHKIYS